MKKVIQAAIIATLLLLSAGTASAADADTDVSIDGTPVEFTQDSGMPFIDVNGRTQVPFRQTLEAFGATVDWDAAARTAAASKNGVTVKVPIDADYIYKDGLKIMNDTKSLIQDGHTYLPIRIVLEAFGADVAYDADAKTVTVKSDGETISLAILAAEASAAAGNIKSMEADAVTSISMTSAGKKLETTQNMKMTVFNNPIKCKIAVTTSVSGANASRPAMEAYLFQENAGSNAVMYMNIGYGFVKTLDIPLAGYENIAINSSLFSIFPKLADSGSEQINGVNAVKLEGKISKELMEEIFSSVDFQNMMASFTGTGGETAMAPAAADIPVAIWVDAESKMILKYSFDMKAYIEATVKAASADGDDADNVEITVDKAMLEMTITNIDKAADFELPNFETATVAAPPSGPGNSASASGNSVTTSESGGDR